MQKKRLHSTNDSWCSSNSIFACWSFVFLGNSKITSPLPDKSQNSEPKKIDLRLIKTAKARKKETWNEKKKKFWILRYQIWNWNKYENKYENMSMFWNVFNRSYEYSDAPQNFHIRLHRMMQLHTFTSIFLDFEKQKMHG